MYQTGVEVLKKIEVYGVRVKSWNFVIKVTNV